MKIEITPFVKNGNSDEQSRVLVNGTWMLTILFWENRYHVVSRSQERPVSNRITRPMKQRSFDVRGAAEEAARTAITDFHAADQANGRGTA